MGRAHGPARERSTSAERWPSSFQKLVLDIIAEKKAADATNRGDEEAYKPDPNEASVQLPGDLMQFELFQFKHNLVEKVDRSEQVLRWLDVVQGPPSRVDDFGKRTGILEYKDDDLLRFYTPDQKARLESHAGGTGSLHQRIRRRPTIPMSWALATRPNSLT